VSNQFLVFTVPTGLYFYLVAAVLVVVPLQAAVSSGRKQLRWQAMLVFAIAVGAGLAFFAVRLAMTDVLLLRVQEHAAAGSVGDTIATYEAVRSARLPGMETDLWFSRLMVETAQKTPDPALQQMAWQAALRAAEDATKQSDAPQNAYYNLAAFYSLRNDFVRTEAALRNAIDAAPMWYKPRWMLAQVLREAGRMEEARDEAARAVNLNGGENPEVAATWKELQRGSQGAK
jgi:tetratricopeptide (TPR) repeat protein